MSPAPAWITAIALLCGCGARSTLADAVVGPPRPLAPLSTATVTSRRPTFRWEPGPGTVAVHLEICRDRACADPLTAVDASGAQATAPTDLPPGALFWRLAAEGQGGVRSDFGPTWQLSVGARSAPVDTSWGTYPDLDGDGLADVVIGAATAFGDEGRAYVYLAGGAGLPATPSVTLGQAGGPQTELGWRVASAGDVDGDGFADLLVSAPCAGLESSLSATPCGSGSVELHRGGPLGPSPTADAILEGPTDAAVSLGWSVTSAGDVNGDGYADVLLAGHCVAPRCDQGVAYLYLGGPGGLAPSPAAALRPPDGAAIGSVASAGDVNGDGFGDVVVGTECFGAAAGPCDGGHAYVYLGSALGLAATPAVALPGDGSSGHAGVAVGSAGDVDGDGYADVLVATVCGLGDEPCGPRHVRSHRGGPLGPSSSPATDLTLAAGVVAVAVDGAGDVDGDGYADIVVGTLSADFLTGAAAVYRGGPSGVATVPSAERSGGGSLGSPVAGAGDVDGDGYADVLVGAPESMGHAGSVTLLHGGPNGIAPASSDTLLGALDGGEFGLSLARAAEALGRRGGPPATRARAATSRRTRAGASRLVTGWQAGISGNRQIVAASVYR